MLPTIRSPRRALLAVALTTALGAAAPAALGVTPEAGEVSTPVAPTEPEPAGEGPIAPGPTGPEAAPSPTDPAAAAPPSTESTATPSPTESPTTPSPTEPLPAPPPAPAAGLVAAPAQLSIETVSATVDPVLGRTRVDYRVVVGSATTYGPLILTPQFSPGLSAIAATWLATGDGAPAGASSISGGPYRLAPAGTVPAPGATHEYAVVVIYRGTAELPACAGPNTGLTAQVELTVPADPDDPAAPTTLTAATCTVPVAAVGGLSVSGTATLSDTDGDGRADAGESIALSYQVVNTGTVNASAVAVTDPLLTARQLPVSCAVTVLGPGQSTTCTATFPVQAGDLVAPVRFSATGSASVTIDAARPVVISSPAWTASVPVDTPSAPTVSASTVNRPTTAGTGARPSAQLAATGMDLRSAFVAAGLVLVGSLLRFRPRPHRPPAI